MSKRILVGSRPQNNLTRTVQWVDHLKSSGYKSIFRSVSMQIGEYMFDTLSPLDACSIYTTESKDCIKFLHGSLRTSDSYTSHNNYETVSLYELAKLNQIILMTLTSEQVLQVTLNNMSPITEQESQMEEKKLVPIFNSKLPLFDMNTISCLDTLGYNYVVIDSSQLTSNVELKYQNLGAILTGDCFDLTDVSLINTVSFDKKEPDLIWKFVADRDIRSINNGITNRTKRYMIISLQGILRYFNRQ